MNVQIQKCIMIMNLHHLKIYYQTRYHKEAQCSKLSSSNDSTGQTRMNCGEMISFALPNQRPVQHDQPQTLNPYYSGRYLVLSLKHKFDVSTKTHNEY